jgi:hypothetical protein
MRSDLSAGNHTRSRIIIPPRGPEITAVPRSRTGSDIDINRIMILYLAEKSRATLRAKIFALLLRCQDWAPSWSKCDIYC